MCHFAFKVTLPNLAHVLVLSTESDYVEDLFFQFSNQNLRYRKLGDTFFVFFRNI